MKCNDFTVCCYFSLYCTIFLISSHLLLTTANLFYNVKRLNLSLNAQSIKIIFTYTLDDLWNWVISRWIEWVMGSLNWRFPHMLDRSIKFLLIVVFIKQLTSNQRDKTEMWNWSAKQHLRILSLSLSITYHDWHLIVFIYEVACVCWALNNIKNSFQLNFLNQTKFKFFQSQRAHLRDFKCIKSSKVESAVKFATPHKQKSWQRNAAEQQQRFSSLQPFFLLLIFNLPKMLSTRVWVKKNVNKKIQRRKKGLNWGS